jgi:hypothetical protein
MLFDKMDFDLGIPIVFIMTAFTSGFWSSPEWQQ